MRFDRGPLPGRVRFAAGAFETLGELVGELELRRLLVIGSASAKPHVTAACERLGDAVADVIVGARAHVPAEDAREAARRAGAADCDGVVAIGGGSAIGLAKAVAVELAATVVAVPTTYAGSEMTAVYGISADGVKRTATSPHAAPRGVLYDPQLTLDVPASVSAETGINAVAHCVEALYAPEADPAMRLVARSGLLRLVRTLPRVVGDPADVEARTEALLGAYQAGMALSCGMGLHHRICHVLGGASMASHGRLNAAVLPHVVALNVDHAPELAAALQQALDRPDVATGLWELVAELGAPTDLAAAGAPGIDPDTVAARVTERDIANPVPVTHAVVRAVVEQARAGARPGGPAASPSREDS